ncbi:MAG: SdpI family protein [Alkalibacterium gilvum]|uniref:SdpI/YhfL protein family protein n=2 Tax=Alkalibacterium gilvum TaxID=1130080 RepID=A0A1H6TCF9_9LACT|nr:MULTISPECIES: SdpI family protein [Alkalibacterium]MDN6409628.1 SdpI family protein [Tetragenococcus halophilus]MDN6294403.1 SdpI family protein [Alkalibacterium sp.]MDN6296065.1 SdpI family protein [Alkalibacterium sp.]MDN6398045.1 SdpI family protein [Alkalibacterium sp.]MDN6729918.1 SdpI family protein [Alkalibacterium sp.]
MKKTTIIWPITLLSVAIIALSFIQEKSQSSIILIGVAVIIALGLLDIFTPRIAKLSETNPKVKTMRRLNRFFILFFAALFTFILWYPKAQLLLSNNDRGITFIVVLVIMGIIGNTSPKLPFNRYMGLRLPWTIRDEETWRVAHRWLGYLTFPIIIIMLTAFLLGVKVNDVATYGIITWIAIPGIYSGWIYYKRMGGK